MTGSLSTVLAVLLLVSGGRHAPLPRLGCEGLPFVMAAALAVASAVTVPSRLSGKQRQRQAFAELHPASGMAAGARPRLPHPPLSFAGLAPYGATHSSPRQLRGMLPHSQAPPRSTSVSL